MPRRLPRLSITLLLSILAFPAIATPSTATIAFNNDADTKWIPFLSYQALFESLHALSKVEPLVIKSMQSSLSEKELKQLDSDFQSVKNKINEFSQPISLFKVFSGLRINITNNKQAYTFNLPKKDALAQLNIKALSIETTDQREIATQQLSNAKAALKSLLPSNTSTSELARFTMAQTNTEKFDSEFIIANSKEASELLAQLVEKNQTLNKQLDSLLKLAIHAKNKKDVAKFNQQFTSQLATFDQTLRDSSLNLRFFTGNSVKLTQNNESKTYDFYPLSLAKFKLNHDDLLTQAHANATLQHTNDMFKWVNNWIFTGNDSLSQVAQNTPDIAGQYHSKEYLAFNNTTGKKSILASNS